MATAIQYCACGKYHDSDERFFVTVADAGRVGYLLGPYETHDEAIAEVDRAKSLARKADPFSHFYAFGTAGMPSDLARKIKTRF